MRKIDFSCAIWQNDIPYCSHCLAELELNQQECKDCGKNVLWATIWYDNEEQLIEGLEDIFKNGLNKYGNNYRKIM